jgi:hypothetical protein
MMPAYAVTSYATAVQPEAPAVQLSDEDRERIVEIHELINLLAAELTKLSQGAAGQYGLPATVSPPVVPYTYSFHQVPYGLDPLAGTRRF